MCGKSSHQLPSKSCTCPYTGHFSLLQMQRTQAEGLHLIRPVRAPKLLDGLVRAPGEFVRQVHPLSLVQRPPASKPTRRLVSPAPLQHPGCSKAHCNSVARGKATPGDRKGACQVTTKRETSRHLCLRGCFSAKAQKSCTAVCRRVSVMQCKVPAHRTPTHRLHKGWTRRGEQRSECRGRLSLVTCRVCRGS